MYYLFTVIRTDGKPLHYTPMHKMQGAQGRTHRIENIIPSQAWQKSAL